MPMPYSPSRGFISPSIMNFSRLTTSLALGCALLLGTHASGQYAVRRSPRSLSSQLRAADLAPSPTKASTRALVADTIRLAPPSKPTGYPDERVGQSWQFGVLRFASTIPVDLSPANSGRWMQDEGGQYIWRCVLQSSGASSMGLRLEDYHLPQGASLYVHGSDGQVRGAFTELNNGNGGLLQLAPVAGETLTIEYELPKGARPEQAKPFRITQLSYGHIELPHLRALDRDYYGFGDGEPYYDFRHRSLALISCAPGVVGYPEYIEASRAVVLMIVNGTALSSAALINNARQDGTAYVLTSAHCINGLYEYATDTEYLRKAVASAVFFFGFQSPSADENIRGSEELSLSGAELVAYDTASDMALLKITGIPTGADGVKRIPASYNAYFAGWDATSAPTAPYHSVHHPSGSTKRISIVEGGLVIKDYDVVADYPWEQKHWYINRWALGATAVGSSGAPLLDSQGRIIGALSGGVSSCSSPRGDYYWSVNKVWTGSSASTSLRPWLDPDNQGITSLGGYDPHSTSPVQRLSPLYARSQQDYQGVHTTTTGVQGLGRSLRLSTSAKVLGAYIVFVGNKQLQAQFPSLTVELNALNGATSGETKWQTSTSSALYRRFDASTSGFTTDTRTLAYDTIELFIPSIGASNAVEAGEYLLGLRSTNSEDLSLPLMYREAKRSTMFHDRPQSFTLGTAGWQASTDKPYVYWIDLLVEGAKQSQGSETAYKAFYHGGKLYISSATEEATDLRIYALDGSLVLHQRLGIGETVLGLDGLLTQQIYIADIRGRAGRYALKFRHTD